MYLQNSMYDRYFPSFNFKHNYFTNTNRIFFVIGQKQKIASLKSWFHASTKNKQTKPKYDL